MLLGWNLAKLSGRLKMNKFHLDIDFFTGPASAEPLDGPAAHGERRWPLQAVMDCHSRHPHYGGGSDQHQKRLERRFGGFCHDDPRQIVVEKILFLIRHALGCGIFAF